MIARGADAYPDLASRRTARIGSLMPEDWGRSITRAIDC